MFNENIDTSGFECRQTDMAAAVNSPPKKCNVYDRCEPDNFDFEVEFDSDDHLYTWLANR